MTAVLKHELRSYFHSLTAYVFGAFLLAFIGIGAVLFAVGSAGRHSGTNRTNECPRYEFGISELAL